MASEEMMQQEQPHSPSELQALRNKRTGLALFQLSWILVFVSLIVANLQVRYTSAAWPPPGAEKFGVALPTAMTLVLLGSSLCARRALRALSAGREARFLAWWRVTIALGALFVVVMASEWLSAPVAGQYGTLFRVMVGFHGLHALAIGAFLLRVYRNGRAGRYDARSFWPVEAAAKLWYFVTAAWLLFYLVIYWV